MGGVAIGTVFLFLVIAFYVVCAIVDCEYQDEARSSTPWAIGGLFAGTLLVTGILLIDSEVHPTPKPIDVYQGHTTLKYTIVDGQPIDSIVIFTEEYLDSLK